MNIFCFRFHDCFFSPRPGDFENGHGAWTEVKLTLPDVVQSFHVQHLPHPHSSILASSIVMSRIFKFCCLLISCCLGALLCHWSLITVELAKYLGKYLSDAAQTNNVCLVRNKTTPILMLPWHYSWPQSLLYYEPNISTFGQKERQTVLLEMHKVPMLPHVSSPAHLE